jgi:hypothetical protein
MGDDLRWKLVALVADGLDHASADKAEAPPESYRDIPAFSMVGGSVRECLSYAHENGCRDGTIGLSVPRYVKTYTPTAAAGTIRSTRW